MNELLIKRKRITVKNRKRDIALTKIGLFSPVVKADKNLFLKGSSKAHKVLSINDKQLKFPMKKRISGLKKHPLRKRVVRASFNKYKKISPNVIKRSSFQYKKTLKKLFKNPFRKKTAYQKDILRNI